MPSTKRTFEWAVGLFEGEGSIAPKNGYLIITLSSADEDVLRSFAAAAGVDGSIYGPHQRGANKPLWTWNARADAAAEFLRNALPLFGERRAERAVEAILSRESFLERALSERTCPECGINFRPSTTRGSRRVFCSSSCRNRPATRKRYGS